MAYARADRQITTADQNHIISHANVWSPDGQWIVYDVRSSAMGDVFDGDRIERVHVDTGEVQALYRSKPEIDGGTCVGVATCSPVDDRIVFIHGPEYPTADWSYAANHRRGVIVHADRPGDAITLDARDLTPPFTPGALRGGSHLHVFSGDGRWVSFTYEDAVPPDIHPPANPAYGDVRARNIGVSIAGAAVSVPPTHRRNHDGSAFSVLVTKTLRDPLAGSDQITRAAEEAWVGRAGYLPADGGRRRERAIAFQGQVRTSAGGTITEVFIVDLPTDLMRPGDGPLQGSVHDMPAPPAGVRQRRLTFTEGRKFPGIQGPRHWLMSSPDGARIAFLMRDDSGTVQLWTISPNGGGPVQISDDSWSVASSFTWDPAGERIAYIADGSVCVLEIASGCCRRLTERENSRDVLLPLACVFSPRGDRVAYLRRMGASGREGAAMRNQIAVVPAGK